MSAQDNNFGHPGDPPSNSPQSQSSLPATIATAQPPAVDWPMAEMGYQEMPATNSITLGGFLTAMRRHGVKAIGYSLLASAVVCGIMWFAIPLEYKAQAYFTIDRDSPSLMTDRNARPMTDPAYETFRQTQAALIKSPTVLQRALRERGISSLPMVQDEGEQAEAWLADEVRVVFRNDSALMEISLYGDDVDDTTTLLQAVYDAYEAESHQTLLSENSAKLKTLRESYAATSRELLEVSNTFETLAKEHGSADSQGAKIDLAIRTDKLRYARAELQNLEREHRTVESDMSGLIVAMQPGEMNFNEHLIEDHLETFPDYADAKFEYTELRNRFAQVQQFSTPGSIAISRAAADMRAAKSKMARIRREQLPRVKDRIMRSTTVDENTGKMQLNVLNVHKKKLAQEIKLLKEDIDTQEQELGQLVVSSGALAASETKKEGLQDTVKEMQVAIRRLEIDKGKPKQIKGISRARVKDESSWLIKTLEIVAGGIATFGLIIFGFTVHDVRARRVNELDDVSFQAGVPVIGSLPALDGSGGVMGMGRLKGDLLEGALNDSVDSIRTALLHNKKIGNISVVMVTSAGGQEGKSTIASQLATSLGRSGRRTLLMDGDIRNPKQHHVFGMSPRMGLCEVLRGQATAGDAIQATQIDGLWVLFGGRCNHQSLRALSSDTLPNLMSQLRSEYDFIVIDAGPVLTGAEPMLIGQYADAALLSVRRDVSQLPKVHAANERLESVGIYVMGAIVNGAASEIRDEIAEPMDAQEAISA